MIFLIINVVFSAILFLVVVLPPLYIYNPARDPGESNEPPKAGEVIPDEDITHAVKQKLYLLFIIPTCATVNAFFLYFAYYRPIRFIHYRVELNLLTLRLTLDAGRQQLQKSGVLNLGNRGNSVTNHSIIGGNNSMIMRNYSKGPGRSFVFDGNENSRKKLASSVSWEWRRHARPKSVRRDAWVVSAVFAEVGDLRDEVEQHFLLEGSVADANFTKAVVKTVGAFVPAPTTTMLESQAKLPRPDVEKKDFYNSSRPPLMAIGARSAASERGHTNMNNSMSDGGGRPRGVLLERDQIVPQRADSVVLVPTESNRRRDGSGNGSGGSGNAALRFLRNAAGGGSGGGSGGSGHTNGGDHHAGRHGGNPVAQSGAPHPSPGERDAFEPVMMDDMSPLEPPDRETAVHGGRHHDEHERVNGEAAEGGTASKPNLWGRLWHKNENKASS